MNYWGFQIESANIYSQSQIFLIGEVIGVRRSIDWHMGSSQQRV